MVTGTYTKNSLLLSYIDANSSSTDYLFSSLEGREIKFVVGCMEYVEL
jgi:hypothetical protein